MDRGRNWAEKHKNIYNSEKIFQDSESRGAQCQHLDSDMEDGYSDEEMYDEYEEEEEEEEEEMDDTKERLAWDKDV